LKNDIESFKLHKAELSLKYGFKYIQDKDLDLKNI